MRLSSLASVGGFLQEAKYVEREKILMAGSYDGSAVISAKELSKGSSKANKNRKRKSMTIKVMVR